MGIYFWHHLLYDRETDLSFFCTNLSSTSIFWTFMICTRLNFSGRTAPPVRFSSGEMTCPSSSSTSDLFVKMLSFASLPRLQGRKEVDGDFYSARQALPMAAGSDCRSAINHFWTLMTVHTPSLLLDGTHISLLAKRESHSLTSLSNRSTSPFNVWIADLTLCSTLLCARIWVEFQHFNLLPLSA